MERVIKMLTSLSKDCSTQYVESDYVRNRLDVITARCIQLLNIETHAKLIQSQLDNKD